MSRLASLFLNDENKNDAQDSAATPEKDRPQTYAILFVDDEPSVLKAMRRIFRQENYLLLTAGSGAQALSILESQKPVHVVVSDHRHERGPVVDPDQSQVSQDHSHHVDRLCRC